MQENQIDKKAKVIAASKKMRDEILVSSFSVGRLALATGLTEKTIYDFILRRTDIKLSTFILLCDTLGLSADEILDIRSGKAH